MKKFIILSMLAIFAIGAFASCQGGEASSSPSQSGNKRPTNPNAAAYNIDKVEELENSAIRGKKIFWLGSSVTLGSSNGASDEKLSMVDYIAKRNSCICVKEAVANTTMIDEDQNAGNGALKSYVYRIEHGAFEGQGTPDLFVCQISTNDARNTYANRFGKVSDLTQKDRESFDTSTTLGAAEFIVSYALETWNCPVLFYSGVGVEETNMEYYETLVNEFLNLQEKWGVTILDLLHDEEFKTLSTKDKTYYMNDATHPSKAGYLLWWTPTFEKSIYKLIK